MLAARRRSITQHAPRDPQPFRRVRPGFAPGAGGRGGGPRHRRWRNRRIAGESGSGKTTLCAALVRALPKAARVSGDIRFDGRSIHALSQDELRQVRGREIAMILQNPMTSLDPLFTIGNQLGEVLATRCDVPGSQLRERELELCARCT
jgi:ABC-type microcin C transport system duplicated ATPase subunit YejF